jgi:hypothetical protein
MVTKTGGTQRSRAKVTSRAFRRRHKDSASKTRKPEQQEQGQETLEQCVYELIRAAMDRANDAELDYGGRTEEWEVKRNQIINKLAKALVDGFVNATDNLFSGAED